MDGNTHQFPPPQYIAFILECFKLSQSKLKLPHLIQAYSKLLQQYFASQEIKYFILTGNVWHDNNDLVVNPTIINSKIEIISKHGENHIYYKEPKLDLYIETLGSTIVIEMSFNKKFNDSWLEQLKISKYILTYILNNIFIDKCTSMAKQQLTDLYSELAHTHYKINSTIRNQNELMHVIINTINSHEFNISNFFDHIQYLAPKNEKKLVEFDASLQHMLRENKELLQSLKLTTIQGSIKDSLKDKVLLKKKQIILTYAHQENSTALHATLKSIYVNHQTIKNLSQLNYAAAKDCALIILDTTKEHELAVKTSFNLKRSGYSGKILALISEKNKKLEKMYYKAGFDIILECPLSNIQLWHILSENLQIEQPRISKTSSSETFFKTSKYKKIKQDFFTALPGYINEIDELFIDKNLEKLVKITNRLENISGTLGIETISKVACKMKKLIREDKLHKLPACIDELKNFNIDDYKAADNL